MVLSLLYLIVVVCVLFRFFQRVLLPFLLSNFMVGLIVIGSLFVLVLF